jgi:hypothetical protein
MSPDPPESGGDADWLFCATPPQTDWVLFRTEPAVVRPACLVKRGFRQPRNGANLWVVGYGWAGSNRANSLNVVRATAAKVPECSSMVGFCLPSDMLYPGMSGGAIFQGDYLVAICVGRVTYNGDTVRYLGLSLPETAQ